VAASFEALSGRNGLILASKEDGLSHADLLADIVFRTSRRSGMILNGSELSSLVHFPQPDIYAPTLARKRSDIRELPPEIVKDEGLLLGVSHEASGSTSISLSPTERLRHMHLIGASGTGKSTLIANSIIQDIQAGHGVALLDPHGDLVEQVLNHIPEERIKDVIIFDPADSEFPVGFNMLSARSEAEKNLLASDFVSIIQRLSSSWGDNMTSILGNAVMHSLKAQEVELFWIFGDFLTKTSSAWSISNRSQNRKSDTFGPMSFPLYGKGPTHHLSQALVHLSARSSCVTWWLNAASNSISPRCSMKEKFSWLH